MEREDTTEVTVYGPSSQDITNDTWGLLPYAVHAHNIIKGTMKVWYHMQRRNNNTLLSFLMIYIPKITQP